MYPRPSTSVEGFAFRRRECARAPETLRLIVCYLAPVMTVSVLLFASYADAFGARRVDVPVSAPCAVTDLVAAMRRMPGGDKLPPNPLVAVNHAFAEYATVVQNQDEVALIPPVAGG